MTVLAYEFLNPTNGTKGNNQNVYRRDTAFTCMGVKEYLIWNSEPLTHRDTFVSCERNPRSSIPLSDRPGMSDLGELSDPLTLFEF